MKRRGFLGTLIASAAAMIAGKLIAKESEPDQKKAPEWAREFAYVKTDSIHKYPLTERECYRQGIVKFVTTVSGSNQQFVHVQMSCSRPGNNTFALFERNDMPGFVVQVFDDSYFDFGGKRIKMDDLFLVDVRPLQSNQKLDIQIGDSVVFYENAMREG